MFIRQKVVLLGLCLFLLRAIFDLVALSPTVLIHIQAEITYLTRGRNQITN